MIMNYDQWLENCRTQDRLLWERAERDMSIRAYQTDRETDSITQREIQTHYDDLKKVVGPHGTYEEYFFRMQKRAAE